MALSIRHEAKSVKIAAGEYYLIVGSICSASQHSVLLNFISLRGVGIFIRGKKLVSYEPLSWALRM